MNTVVTAERRAALAHIGRTLAIAYASGDDDSQDIARNIADRLIEQSGHTAESDVFWNAFDGYLIEKGL